MPARSALGLGALLRMRTSCSHRRRRGGGPRRSGRGPRALSTQEGSLGHIAQGELALHVRAWAAAEQAYHRALEQDPENANALLNYGYALSRQGKDARAIDAYTEAGRLDPRSSYAAQNIVTASQRHLSLKGTWRDRSFRLVYLVASYAFGILLASSQWIAASAIGVFLLVGLVILIVAPYRRLRNLPESARSVLGSARATDPDPERGRVVGARTHSSGRRY